MARTTNPIDTKRWNDLKYRMEYLAYLQKTANKSKGDASVIKVVLVIIFFTACLLFYIHK